MDNSIDTKAYNGKQLKFTYFDKNNPFAGRLQSVTDLNHPADTVAYAYDNDRHVASETLPGGISRNFTYHLNGQLQTLKHTLQGALTDEYAYDYWPSGNLK